MSISVDVEDGLRVRFPGREGAFREGVEIGLLLADLAAGLPDVERRLSAGAVPQAVALADAFGYRCLTEPEDEGRTRLRCLRRGLRPKLRVV